MDKFVGAAYGAGSPTLFLSGDKQDFPSRDLQVKKRPPGQGFLVTPDGKEVVQAVYIDPPEEVHPPPSPTVRIIPTRITGAGNDLR